MVLPRSWFLPVLLTASLRFPVTAEPPAAAPPATYEIPPDRSFLPDDYSRLGVPGYDRPWSGTDMVQAAKALGELGKKKPQRLPRYNSERSGLVFSRLVDPENMALYRDRTLPLDSRFQQALSHVQASNEIHKVYVAAFMKKAVADSEMIELTGGMLRLVTMMFDLVDELAPSLSKQDPAQAKRLGGLDQMKQGFSKVVFASLRTMAEANTRPGERLRLIQYLVEALPLLIPRMQHETCVEIRQKLVEMSQDATLAELQPALGELKVLVLGLVPDAPVAPASASPASAAPSPAPAGATTAPTP